MVMIIMRNIGLDKLLRVSCLVLGIAIICGCLAKHRPGESTPDSSNQAPSELREKVLASELIVVARIRGSYGSHLLSTEIKDPRVIWGRKESNTTLVVLQRPTPLSLSAGPDTQWIFFLRKATKTHDSLEYHLLIGGDEDYNGMEIATDDRVQEVIRLVEQLKEKVLASDLIVVGRIKTWYGSHLVNTLLEDPRVIWGKTATNTTLVVLQKPTTLFLSAGRNTQWIFFLRKAMDTRDGFEFHKLVGGDEDYNGMQIATDDQVKEIIHLVEQLKVAHQ